MGEFSLVLLAGGVGSRMKEEIPKQHLLLHGKPIIVHVLERVDNLDAIKEIVVTCPKNHIKKTQDIIESYGISKQIYYIEGGNTRQESTYLALQQVTQPNVIIHEAARPFVKNEEFQALIDLPDENATYAIDIPFTVLKGTEYIEDNLKRSELVNIQLPQKFNTEKLKQAHEWARDIGKEYTEDASLFFEYFADEKIKIIAGTEYNLKITKPIDLNLAGIIYKNYILGEE